MNTTPEKKKALSLASMNSVEGSILLLRGQKVILDLQLAGLYGVPTKALIQAVKRNRERFPEDFMFRLNPEEQSNLRSQFVTSNLGDPRGGRRYLAYAFTEQGVAILSSVLRSRRAVAVNIEIMRAFVRLRRILSEHRELAAQLREMEKKYDGQFRLVFDAIRQLMAPPIDPPQKSSRERIGFR